MIKTKAIIDQHLHGAYGIDFLDCTVDEMLECARLLKKDGVTCFFPTLATAPIEILKRQISIIEESMMLQSQQNDIAKIGGVNLEACFVSAAKKGIHDVSQLLKPTIENFKLLENEAIKIVTLAPEEDERFELTDYLKSKGIKVFAGHTVSSDLSEVDGVTHLFNAMAGIAHREKNTVTSALLEDRLFCEIIADGYHIDFDNVKLAMKVKPKDRLILISDALPIAKSNKEEMEFCSKKIYLKEGKATDETGTLAGSSMLLPDIIRKLVTNNVITLEQACNYASNSALLFGFEFNDYILWDEDLNILDVVTKQ